MRKIIAVLLLFGMFTSCIPLKKQVYFQGELNQADSIAKVQDQVYRLQVDDLLDIQIKSSDENLQKILYNLFYDVLNIEFNLWVWIRSMCKYGDYFLKLEISEKYGVYNVIPINAFHMERQDGYNQENPASTRFKFHPGGVIAASDYS